MRWSNWTSLRSGIPPGQSAQAGLINADLLPATAFQLRYFIQIQEDARDIEGGIDYRTRHGRWRWTIEDGGGNVKFDQTTDLKIDMMILAAGWEASTVSFFTWWIDYSGLRIYTEVPQPVYTLGRHQGGFPPTDLAQITLTAPGQGAVEYSPRLPLAARCAAVPLSPLGPRSANVSARLLSPNGDSTQTAASLAAGASKGVAVAPDNAYWECTNLDVSGGTAGDRIAIQTNGWVQSPSEQGVAYVDPSGYPGNTAGDDVPEESGYTDYRIYINFWYYSPVYLVSIPVNSHLRIPFHNIGAVIESFISHTFTQPQASAASWLVKYANVQIRTAKGGGQAALIDRPGYHRGVVVDGNVSSQVYSATEGRTYDTRNIPVAFDSPSMFKTRENHLVVAGWAAREYYLLLSKDDGRTWTRVSHWSGVAMPASVWPDDTYEAPATVLGPGGSLVSIATKGSSVYCRSSARGFEGMSYVGAAGDFPMTLTYDSARDYLIASDLHTRTYISKDAGQTWQAS